MVSFVTAKQQIGVFFGLALIWSCFVPFFTLDPLLQGNEEVIGNMMMHATTSAQQTHTTMPTKNKSYEIYKYNPLLEKDGMFEQPYQVLNVTRINQLIAPERKKKGQTQPYQLGVLCGCFKCGTNSVYDFLFQQIFNHSFTGDKDRIQITDSEPWDGVFYEDTLPVAKAQETLSHPQTFSIAIIREPISRLVSAWKNKLACDEHLWNTHLPTREKMTKYLLEDSKMPIPQHIQENHEYCLEFSEFVEALRLMYSEGDQDWLDVHFIPQQLYCFRTADPSIWTHIAIASDPSVGPILANFLGLKNDNVTLAKLNSSGRQKTQKPVLEISDHDMSILKDITFEERAIIDPLLQKYKRA